MYELPKGTDWETLLTLAVYGTLILLYFIVLKLLLNCLQQLMSKSSHGGVRSVIDLDIIHDETNRHIEEEAHAFDFYNFALTFIKISLILASITTIYVIMIIKLNVFLATAAAIILGVAVWQLKQWRDNKGKKIAKQYENILIEVGGYNAGTLIFLVIALILIMAGLIFLP